MIYEQPTFKRARLDMVNAGYEARSELALKRAQLERLKQKLSRPPQQQPETDLDRARRRLAALR